MSRFYPCDGPDCYCPFDARYGEDCRRNCGLGVDEDSYDDEDNYEPDDSNIEVGYDPYSGCYTDDC